MPDCFSENSSSAIVGQGLMHNTLEALLLYSKSTLLQHEKPICGINLVIFDTSLNLILFWYSGMGI
ncbi:hypothetical protein BGZ60DRAFT_414763, partial [Tricladium varicosporioides]